MERSIGHGNRRVSGNGWYFRTLMVTEEAMGIDDGHIINLGE
jgi:hypothetical protein